MDIAEETHGLLGNWRAALLRYVRSGHPDLTNRQMALLLVTGQETGPHTVRGLAARLGVSKPVVTRALNSLSGLGLVRRRRDERDRRSVFVDLTGDGETFLVEFADMIGGETADRADSGRGHDHGPSLHNGRGNHHAEPVGSEA